VFGEFGKTLVGDMPFDNLEVDIAVYAKFWMEQNVRQIIYDAQKRWRT
jgi:hypothetical protein